MYKESYFTPGAIDRKAQELYREYSGRQRQRAIRFAPERSALLVLDMQSYFLDASSHAYVPSAKAIIPRINALSHAYLQRALPVVFTRHVNTPQDAGVMALWWRDLIVAGDPWSEINPKIEFSTGDVIQKSQYDAFYGTDLEGLLRRKDVDQVVISGVMTHLCCETTARSAFMRGFEVFFLVDGTATYNEEFHRAALLNLAHGCALMMLVDKVLAKVGEADGD